MKSFVWEFAILALLTGALPVAQLVSQEPDRNLLAEAAEAASKGERKLAVKLASRAIERNPGFASAYYLRGREHFRLGKVHESVADFDKFVELMPQAEPRLWERGISYYYDGQFAKGAKQFELYQTFQDNDVENSVWRFLCLARIEGVAKARATMLPIENDRRVPMMQIYALYRGELQRDDVLQAVEAGSPNEQVRNHRLFYAHLYLGLFYEAHGDDRLSKEHLALASDRFKIGHYMWDVAHVHANRLRSHDKASSKFN